MRAALQTVKADTSSIERFEGLLGRGQWLELGSTMREFAHQMRGRRLWNVNSTAHGGGVVEMLSSLIPYDRGCEIDERWIVIEGSPAFFKITKRLHNLLHGVASDGVEISPAERREYVNTLSANADALDGQISAGDVAILHDPQVAGLVPALARRGVNVIWRCHIGVDTPNDAARSAWRMLAPYLNDARAVVFSRARYAWEGLDPARVHIIAPVIDPFSVKNRDLEEGEIATILGSAGIDVAPDARIVTQVGRWDRLKDPAGVLEAFAKNVAPATDAVLVLAGPAVRSVDDDPEQPEILDEVTRKREALPAELQARILIVQLPMEDVERNATMVNALQRRADVVVQKSIAEGFGLTVAEAMWKARPIVASRVGGIEDQIEDGKSGILVEDPRDLSKFGTAVAELLQHPEKAKALGEAARRRAIEHFLVPRHLVEQARLIMAVAPRA